MRFKQFGMIVVMLLLTVAIGGFGCSSSSDDDTASDIGGGDDDDGGLKAIAPADFSAGTGQLSITPDGKIESSGDIYSFILTGDVQLPEDATEGAEVTYEWTAEGVEGVVIATPNEKSTEVEIPDGTIGTVEFKLTVTYEDKSSEAVTTVTLLPGILYVNDADVDGRGDASSWGSALSGNGKTANLQNVIDTARDAVAKKEFDSIEIWVKAGTYLPTWSYDADGDAKKSSFTLRNGVSVIGGFAGDEVSKSARVKSDVAGRIYASETVLSGDLEGDDDSVVEYTCATLVAGDPTGAGNKRRIPLTETDIDCSEEGAYIKELKEPSTHDDNVYHVVYNNGSTVLSLDKTAILDGVVIRGGNAEYAATDDQYGGGIYNYGPVNPTIISTIVENNRARRGGGIYSDGLASPTIISSIIQYNYTRYAGAGIATYGGASSKIDSSIIQYNYAKHEGGGISTYDSSNSYVTASLIKSNYAAKSGGGVAEQHKSHSSYRASVIKNNAAAEGGGGVFLRDDSSGFHPKANETATTITSSIIQSNFALTDGGGGFRLDDKVTLGLVNSAVIENISKETGAAIDAHKNMRRVHIYNSIVSDNITSRVDKKPELREIDSSSNHIEDIVVFSSIVQDVVAEDSNSRDAKVTFYNMLDGTDALNLVEIDFGSYIDSDTGETYTLPNPITTVVKSVAPNSAYSNAGVTVGTESDFYTDFYYQAPDGEDTWYNFQDEDVTRPDDFTIIPARDIYGNVDAGQPDIGPVTMPTSN